MMGENPSAYEQSSFIYTGFTELIDVCLCLSRPQAMGHTKSSI